MRIAVVSLYDDNMIQVGEVSSLNFIEYGKRWNYEVVIYKTSLKPNRHPSWSKIIALRTVLLTRIHDWVFWIDCDSLFMNHTISLESKIEEGTGLLSDRQKGAGNLSVPFIIFSSDLNGISAGSMFIKNCDWSCRFLEAVDLCGEPENNNPDGHGNKWEQNTIKHLLATFPELAVHSVALPQQSTNYHYHARDFPLGGFILHFPSLSNAERLRAMKEVSLSVIR